MSAGWATGRAWLMAGLVIACGGQRMDSGTFVIMASFPADEAGLTHRLRLDETGRAEFTVENSDLPPDVQAIGVYRTEIGAQAAADIKNALTALDRRGVPPVNPAPPGTEMVLISLQEGGTTRERMIDPSTASPAMCRAADRLKDIGQRARRHPLRVVEMAVAIAGDRVPRGGPISIRVRLTPRGSEAVKIVDPFTQGPAGAASITVRAVRSDLPPADLWPHHSRHLVVTADQLAGATTPPPREPGLLTLEPSQAAEYTLRVPIDWDPGRYALRVSFETLGTRPDVLRGRIISPPQEMVVASSQREPTAVGRAAHP